MPSDATTEHLPLSPGDPATGEDWEQAVAAVLRKRGLLGEDAPADAVWGTLARTTLDGIPVLPLGTPEAAAGLPGPGLPGRPPFTRGSEPTRQFGGWDIRARFEDPDAALSAEHVSTDLENGVNSLWLVVGTGAITAADLPQVLEPVLLDLAPVVLDAPEEPVRAASELVEILVHRRVRPAPGTNLGANPIGHRHAPDVTTEIVRDVADLAVRERVRGLVVDGTDTHDRGASEAQELAYTLATGAAYLRLLAAAGHDVDTAARLMEFRYAATAEQFPTIAKLRAARRLWARVLELSGVGPEHRGQAQHAVTSRPMMTRYDPWVNMLRTTVAAFSAGVGGAGAVTVLPFDEALGLPEAFSRRIARNTSSILVEESHVAVVTDPAGGAHAVEKLTDDLARAAWDLFGDIEEDGGIETVLADGSWDERVATIVSAREEEVATRRRPLTGVSEFPVAAEVLPQRRPYPRERQVVRYGAAYERLRDAPADQPVFLATMGTVAQHTARASFMVNLLTAGGVPVHQAGATTGVDQVLAAYDGSPVVCLVGADGAYADWGADLVTALRDAGAEWVVLAGSPVEGVAVDDTAAAGLNALDFLHRTRDRLGAGRPDTDDPEATA